MTGGAGRLFSAVPVRPEFAAPSAGDAGAAAVPSVAATPSLGVHRPATVIAGFGLGNSPTVGGRPGTAAEASSVAAAAEAAATATAQVVAATAVAVAAATAEETASSAATSGADTRTDLQGTTDKAVDAASAAVKTASGPLLGR
jgi:hypothetical protein